MDNCIFCKIINGEIPAKKIYEDDIVICFLDINPVKTGHTLIIPKKHFENIFDCDDLYLSEVIKAVKLIANHYKSLGFKAVNILNASGKEAEQSVFHLHFHILPKKSLEEFKSWPVLPGEKEPLDKQFEKLRIK